MAATLAVTTLVPSMTVPASALFGLGGTGEGDRTLYLHHTHTGETGSFTFKRNGRYDQGELKRLNVFLADWRTKEPTNMDPALFDLLWEVYQDVGGKQPYNIVSSYRSPKTNKMLASKSSGVADNSQHMKGKAMDVFIPGVNLSKLREAAMRHQVGGVGYYPTSGSPFVHMDTGNVRAWPRMTRAQLKKVFPDGKTLHLPTDGKPLSNQGRAYAQAEWTKCRMVPCGGGQRYVAEPETMLADNSVAAPQTRQPELVAPVPAMRPRAFDGAAEIIQVAMSEPTQRMVPTFEVTAPIPVSRRSDAMQVGEATPVDGPSNAAAFAAAGAPMPLAKSQRVQLATRSALDGETAVAALEAMDGVEPGTLAAAGVVTAYVPTGNNPAAQKALEMIIERETTAAVPLPSPQELATSQNIRTASLGVAPRTSSGLKGMFDSTFDVLGDGAGQGTMQQALAQLAQSRQPNQSITLRTAEFVAPELDHVNETLVKPDMMHTAFWSELTDAEGYLDKGTELGPLTGRVAFLPENAAIPAYDRFVTDALQVVAQY